MQQRAETEGATLRVGGRIRGLGGPDWVGNGVGEAVRTYGAVSDLRRDLVVMCVTRAGISDMIPGRILWRAEITTTPQYRHRNNSNNTRAKKNLVVIFRFFY